MALDFGHYYEQCKPSRQNVFGAQKVSAIIHKKHAFD